jgi:hypothetical protein
MACAESVSNAKDSDMDDVLKEYFDELVVLLATLRATLVIWCILVHDHHAETDLKGGGDA